LRKKKKFPTNSAVVSLLLRRQNSLNAERGGSFSFYYGVRHKKNGKEKGEKVERTEKRKLMMSGLS
jgi:ribosomal protein S13